MMANLLEIFFKFKLLKKYSQQIFRYKNLLLSQDIVTPSKMTDVL
jgi:hypothetical protein